MRLWLNTNARRRLKLPADPPPTGRKDDEMSDELVKHSKLKGATVQEHAERLQLIGGVMERGLDLTPRKDDEMSDDLVKRLRIRASYVSGPAIPLEAEAAARIAALEAALAKADALADSVDLIRCGDDQLDALQAYREARKLDA